MWSHFQALFTKHIIIAKRSPLFTFIEFIAPVLALWLIALIRRNVDPTDILETN
jgi:hypothetical protein